jgi:hypothetical protein
MIGHYLLSLTAEQEDRVLTQPMRPGVYLGKDGCRCFVGTATGLTRCAEVVSMGDYDLLTAWQDQYDPARRDYLRTGVQYDNLCARFGKARINAAIRDRIITNRIWRAVSPQEAFAAVTHVGLAD